MFKVWMNDGQNPKPKEPVFYEIAANGTFIHKDMRFWKASVPVDRISVLQTSQPSIEFYIPKIPKDIALSVVRFFSWINTHHGTEVAALLWFNAKERAYRITIPKQSVSRAHIHYDLTEKRLADEFLVGTFHSHGYMDAYHSEVDRKDELSSDGIHFTLGRFSSGFYGDSSSFAISAEAAINGHRFKLEPENWLDGAVPAAEERSYWTPPDAIEKNKDEKSDTAKYAASGVQKKSYYEPPEWWRRHNSPKYTMEGEVKLLPSDYKPPEGWVEQVKFESEVWHAFRENWRDKKPGAVTDKSNEQNDKQDKTLSDMPTPTVKEEETSFGGRILDFISDICEGLDYQPPKESFPKDLSKDTSPKNTPEDKPNVDNKDTKKDDKKEGDK